MNRTKDGSVLEVRPGSVVTVRNVHDRSDSFAGVVIWHSDITVALQVFLGSEWPFYPQTVQIPTAHYVIVLERSKFEGIEGLVVHETSILQKCFSTCIGMCDHRSKAEKWRRIVKDLSLRPEVCRVLIGDWLRFEIRLAALSKLKIDQSELFRLSYDGQREVRTHVYWMCQNDQKMLMRIVRHFINYSFIRWIGGDEEAALKKELKGLIEQIKSRRFFRSLLKSVKGDLEIFAEMITERIQQLESLGKKKD